MFTDSANALFFWQLLSVVGFFLGFVLTCLKIWDSLRPHPPMSEQISKAIERMISEYATKAEMKEQRQLTFEELEKVEKRCSNHDEQKELKKAFSELQASISAQFISLERAIGRIEGRIREQA